MKRLALMSVVMCGVSVFGAETMTAATLPVPAGVRAMLFAKEKLVGFSLRNDSDAPLKLKAGDQEMAIAPGKTMDVKLPVGTQVVATEATRTMAAGAIVASVTKEMGGVTIAVH